MGKIRRYSPKATKQCPQCKKSIAVHLFQRYGHGDNCDPGKYSKKISFSPEVKADSKYNKWYFQIVNRAQSRVLLLGTYVEKHHIIPKSLGGSNLPANLVKLTAREHFICHWLLTKMYVGEAKSKMIYALSMMKSTIKKSGYHQRYSSGVASRVYAANVVERSKINSLAFKGRIVSAETRKKLSAAKLGKKGHPTSDATKEKLRITSTGRVKSEEEKRKSSERQKGKKLNAEHIRKLSVAAKNRKKFTCVHCGVTCDQSNFTRCHGDNCKHKNQFNTLFITA